MNVVNTLTFGINFSYFVYNEQRLHCSIVSHARHIVACGPRRLQIELCCHRLFTGPVRCIERHHEVLEVREQQRQERIDTSSLWIFVKIFYYLISLENIPFDDCCLQFEHIEVLAYSYFTFYNFGCDASVVVGQ